MITKISTSIKTSSNKVSTLIKTCSTLDSLRICTKLLTESGYSMPKFKSFKAMKIKSKIIK